MNVGKLAWNNVWRNARRSLVTMSAMSVALAALLVFASLLQGLTTGLERSVVELETGDVQIAAPGYRDKPSIFSSIAAADALVVKLEAAGFRASARVRANGLAAGDKSSSGAQMIGIDAAHDRAVSRVYAQVSRGRWLDPADEKGVVVGGKLAKSLTIDVGGDILLLGTAADGSMANEIYKVRGVLEGTGEAVDRAGVFLNAATLRALMALPEGGAHQIIVRRPAMMTLDEAGRSVSAIAVAQDTQTWRDLLPTVAQLLDNQRASRIPLALIVFTAVGIVILNAMMMAVFERIRELGVLKAIGMQPGTVFVLVMAEGAVQTLLALVAGVVLALGPLYYCVERGIDIASLAGVKVQGIAYQSRWRGELDAPSLAIPIILLALVAFIAALFPALRAARLEPIDAIQHQ